MSNTTTLKLRAQFVGKVNTFIKANFKNVSLKDKTAVSQIIIPRLSKVLTERGEEDGENFLYYSLHKLVSSSDDKKVVITNDELRKSLDSLIDAKKFKQPSNTDKSKSKGLGRGGPKTKVSTFSFTKTKPSDQFISDHDKFPILKSTFDSFAKKVLKINKEKDEEIYKVLYEEACNLVFNGGIKRAEYILKGIVENARTQATHEGKPLSIEYIDEQLDFVSGNAM